MDQQTRLIEMLMSSKAIGTLLRRSGRIQVPNWYVAAGSIPTVVWNCLTGHPPDRLLNDIDLIYFDNTDLSEGAENVAGDSLRTLFADLSHPLDVKNQARVHLWYRDKNGQPIPAYNSSEEAIDLWLSVTAVGIRCDNGTFNVYAPFGLNDLFSMQVRPNRKIISRDHYDRKIESWQQQWPEVEAQPYDE